MIGPMKKKVITSSVVTAVILIVIFVLIAFFYVKNTNNQISTLKKESEVVERFVFSGDLLAGQVIGANNIKVVKVKAESAPIDSYLPTEKGNVIGRTLKVNALDKTIVADSMFFDEEGEPKDDLRMQEYNMITLPSNLNVGDYVDIRMRLATGEDYIVLVGKKIEEFGATGAASNTIFLKLNEEEIIRMSSAIIESYIDEGINLYANKYVEPSTQLFDYSRIDLVAAYNNNRYMEGAEQFSINASGELVSSTERKERSINEIATLIGITPSEVEEIKNAVEKNDAEVLEKYKNKEVSRSKSLTVTYPVRAEVATLIRNNPNILEIVKEKYNIENLESQRVNFMVNNNSFDTESANKFNAHVTSEIERQKTERQQYLRGLLNVSSD